MRFINKESPENEYKCVTCGSSDVTILREDPKDPGCKCNSCGFVFSGAMSIAAQEAGAIGDSSPEALADAYDAEREQLSDHERRSVRGVDETSPREVRETPQKTGTAIPTSIPRAPAYVFISKDRRQPRVEFCGAKDVERIAVKWYDIKHDIFELTAKKFDVKVNIT